MRCEHEHDDGAYVLGALSPGERATYERHLKICAFCREAVAEVATLPELLGRLDAADFARLVDGPSSGLGLGGSSAGFADHHARAAMLPAFADQPPAPRGTEIAPARRRKHMRTRILMSSLAAAVVALIAGIGAMFLTQDAPEQPKQGPTVAMTAVDSTVPIAAWLNLSGANGGTKVGLICSYDKNSPSKKSYTVRLMAYGPDDEFEQLGSWIAAPGKEFTMSGTTHFALGSVDRFALVRNDGKELLFYDVP